MSMILDIKGESVQDSICRSMTECQVIHCPMVPNAQAGSESSGPDVTLVLLLLVPRLQQL